MNNREMTREDVLRAMWDDYRRAAANGEKLAAIRVLERLGNMLGMFRPEEEDAKAG
jgi:hypothetical protein